jgi:monovalent cation/hydrogen antiporter
LPWRALAFGYNSARLWMLVAAEVSDAPSAIILQFAGTFTVCIIAERIGMSGILSIVAFAFTISRTAPARIPARLRVPSYAVWETAVFVLNVLAFTLIGMQLRPIWIRLDEMVRLQYCEVAACVLAAVILARIVWVMSYGTILRTLVAQGLFHRKNTLAVPTVKGGLVTSWCGMRGHCHACRRLRAAR